jgi:hypothetical protein
MNLYSIKNTIFSLAFSCLLFPFASNGQFTGTGCLPGMKVNQMSDQQIMQFWQQAQRSGCQKPMP